MTVRTFVITTCVCTWLLAGCGRGGPGTAEDGREVGLQSAGSGEPSRFNGVWEVTGRTGNEDGTNEPVCGYETGFGTVTIENSKITGNITNKSGFEYTVEGAIDGRGKIKAMLIYSGYDAAELFGTFSAETDSAKGNWKDAVNACPGVWKATRVRGAATAPPAGPDVRKNPSAASENPAKKADS